MPDGDPALFGRWRNADRTAADLDARPTKTPGSNRAVPNPTGDPDYVGDDNGVFAVHMALMHTGRVLMFSGRSESDENMHRSWSWDPFTAPADAIGRWVIDGYADLPPWPTVPGPAEDEDSDLFCAHHVFLEDGCLLVVGGDHTTGHTNKSVHIYNPRAENWIKLPNQMQFGRWYPTAVLLPDGSVLVFSGDSDDAGVPEGLDRTVEHLAPPAYIPRTVAGGIRQVNGSPRALQSYPSLHLVPSGEIFYTFASWQYAWEASTTDVIDNQLGDTSSFQMRPRSAWADPNVPEGSWTDHSDTPTQRLREEGTAVLLPPAQDGRILVIGGGWWDFSDQQGTPRSCEILDNQAATPTWSDAGEMHSARVNANAVLLPDGKVFIFGGHEKHKRDHADPHPANEAEIYDPAVAPTAADPSAPFTQVAVARAARMYHSTGVLLPDATVLVAGGEERQHDTFGFAEDQQSMEVYEPPYCHQGPRPVINGDIVDTGVADNVIYYGGQFTIMTPDAADIDPNPGGVVLMRPGCTTHHTDSEQRLVHLSAAPTAGGLRVQCPDDPSVAPPGYYMVFIVTTAGVPCERAKFVRLGFQHCELVTDRSEFSVHGYMAAAVGGVAEMAPAIYLKLHGYRPEQLGVTDLTPAAAPDLLFSDAATGASIPTSEIEAFATRLLLEVPGPSFDIRQRVTFEYGLRFKTEAVFPADGAVPPRRALNVAVQGHPCVGQIELFRQPNPYMLDGPTHWLSEDLRVFSVTPGTRNGQSGRDLAPGQTPLDYLNGFVNACRTTAPSLTHPFDLIPLGQSESALPLATEVEDADGVSVPAYNFAIARARYRSRTDPAPDVRVFFRLFTTAATNMAFQPQTYPTDEGTELPELGADTEVLTIPCFGSSRDTLTTLGDPLNVESIDEDATGAEVHQYFGVWLDFNQDTPRYPDPADGGAVKSIKELIRNRHQCLVAEIHFHPDPINPNATPANSENLAQRNLIIVDSDNPGGEDAHTVQTTFELMPTQRPKEGQHVERHVGIRLPGEPPSDEIMLVWGDLPRDAEATIYLPSLDAGAIVAEADRLYGPKTLEQIDAHTVRCQVADVTYIPIPASFSTPIPGLLTVRLPPTVETGESYRVLVRHHARALGRIVGTFELFISVSTQAELQAPEARDLAVFRHIASRIPLTSRWTPIIQRYLATMENRLRGFGGDPNRVEPDPRGGAGRGDAEARESARCTRVGWATAALLAASLVSLGLAGSWLANITVGVLATALAVVGVYWALYCRVGRCRRAVTLAAGASLGAAVLGALVWLGATAPAATQVISLGALLTAAFLILALVWCRYAPCARDRVGHDP